MAGIFGDGQRGGIFGARVNPRLQAELERRAGYRQAYTTALSPMQELKFRDWKQRFAPNDSGEDYDLRGAFKAGFQPDPETGHWPDVYKKPNHPTFSNQSIYARDKPELAGSWNGDTYVPSPLRQQMDAEQQAPEQSTISSRAQDWWNKSTFFKPAWDDLVGGLTAPGDVMSGAQPTMAADPQTGEFHTDPRLMDRAGALAGAVTLGAGAVPAETDALRMGIKAYHGSPHDFERFDSSKIGTGEGAQAYGHGLYFAEREGVAREYRNKLGGAERVEVDGKPIWNRGETTLGRVDLPREQQLALDAITRFVDPEEAARFLQGRSPTHEGQGFHEARLNAIELLRSGRMTVPTRGKMYEVDIAADPEHFLDWDKPLSEQKLKAEAIDPVLSRAVPSPKNPQPYTLEELSGMGATGRDLYDRLSWASGKPGAFPEINVATPAGASGALREAGIPGIRYLDQGSRTKGTVVAGDGKPTGYHNIDSMIANTYGTWEKFKAANPNPSGQLKAAIDDLDARGGVKFNRDAGTSNFVIFPGNEHLIAVLRKYGLPISAAGLAALSQLHPEEAQAAQRNRAPAASK